MVPPLLPRLSVTLAAKGGKRGILLGFPFAAITAEPPWGKESRMLQAALAALPSHPLLSRGATEIHINTGSLLP